MAHPASNFTTDFQSNLGVATDLPTDKVRASIEAQLKTYAASLLTNVPADRIAVALI